MVHTIAMKGFLVCFSEMTWQQRVTITLIPCSQPLSSYHPHRTLLFTSAGTFAFVVRARGICTSGMDVFCHSNFLCCHFPLLDQGTNASPPNQKYLLMAANAGGPIHKNFSLAVAFHRLET